MLSASEVIHAGADLFLAGAVIGCAYLLVAAVLTIGFDRSEDAAADPVPVTVLVPLCGSEPDLVRRLTALCRQDYSAPIQVLCGLQSGGDPALNAVKTAAAIPGCDGIEWHVEPRLHGRSRKISNLINILQHARYDTFILVDSDVEVAPSFVSEMVATLQRPGVGAVTCLYHGVTGGGLWARLASLRINAHFLPNVMVALGAELAEPCFGAGLALSRNILERIGGFHAFADELWDDYAIGEAIRNFGATVAVTSFALGHVYTDRSARELFTAELRAARTIKNLEPQGYAGSVITHPFALALVAAGLGAGSPALATMLAAFVCRIVVCRCIEQRFEAPATSYLLLPLRDVLSFVVHVASYFGSSVTWRGQRYRLSDRTLIPG